MIAKPEREQIIALINREVVPAIGCTEPIKYIFLFSSDYFVLLFFLLIFVLYNTVL